MTALSNPMQETDVQTRPSHLSHRLEEARERFRQIRKGLYKPFRKTRKFTIEILPSPIHNTSEANLYWQPPEESIPSSRSSQRSVTPIMDGVIEKKIGNTKAALPVSAIFVHAGAGYHSTTNQHIHLGACTDAARMAIKVLKSGGTAVEAVEAAIKVLEDREITNAGYGSNLTIEGIVECDATIVDYLGRSGACGATSKIKNPIQLARLILDESSRPLSLRRVPPNLLVGEGASDFAWEHGMPIVPLDAIVSKSARDRFLRWKEDLKRAGGVRVPPETPDRSSTFSEDQLDLEYEERMRNKNRRDHINALLTGTWNEGQPDSPMNESPSLDNGGAELVQQLVADRQRKTDSSPVDTAFLNPLSLHRPARISPQSTPAKRPRYSSRSSDSPSRTLSLLGPIYQDSVARSVPNTGLTTPDIDFMVKDIKAEIPNRDVSPLSNDSKVLTYRSAPREAGHETVPIDQGSDPRGDTITDTVGAIAIDMYGNIAAGSSSGGIGMKHRGRVGPAALVGIGTAVVPAYPDDPDKVTVAAVTSGTGEHMATTLASQRCAERLYNCTRHGKTGNNLPTTEEEAMESFVVSDFMNHPGVKSSHSPGAIGVMAVKKTPQGYFLHFAHNTDSFALASMHSNERDAKCVMSRIGDQKTVVQGGRKIRID